MKKTTWIILSLVAVVLLTAMGFCIKQYYHFAVSNFQSMDGESHSYHVYPDMTTDSLMTEMLGDYAMASDLAWCLHCKYLVSCIVRFRIYIKQQKVINFFFTNLKFCYISNPFLIWLTCFKVSF